MAAMFVSIVGLVLIGQGLSIEARSESAMHQVYGAQYIAGGVVTVALALLIGAVNAGVKVLKAIDARQEAAILAPPDVQPVQVEAPRNSKTISEEYKECPACGRENGSLAVVCQCGNRLAAAA